MEAVYQNLCDWAKAFLRGKITEINAYISKEEKPQNNPTLCLQELEREDQTEPKADRRKEIWLE